MNDINCYKKDNYALGRMSTAPSSVASKLFQMNMRLNTRNRQCGV